jgi:hypothetical protein
MTEMSNFSVTDSFGVRDDPAMPFLAQALDPLEMQRQFEIRLPYWASQNKPLRVCAIRVVRHKPGRRCLIEYDVETLEQEGPNQLHTLVGKTRAKGMDDSTYRLLVSLYNAGFGENSADGILVPEPLGTIPKLHLWLQRKVPGVTASQLLYEPRGIVLARRIAAAAHKLHIAAIPATRRHTMADELRLLHDRLPLVAELRPEWAGRVERLLTASDRLGAAIPESSPVGIHRDFYPDQVLVDGERLYLLDFDLYCNGNPGLDVGNFVGHITEHALRTTGDAGALSDREQVIEECFVRRAGAPVRPAIQAYTILTLVRHIYLSTQFADRRRTTAALVELCEERLGIASSR